VSTADANIVGGAHAADFARRSSSSAGYPSGLERVVESTKDGFDGRGAGGLLKWEAEGVTLYCGDSREVLPLIAGVDAVVTDPPYKREFIELYAPVFAACDRAMKESALCVAMCGQAFLPQVVASFPAAWEYIWTGCYMVNGARVPIWPRGISAGWKPLFIYGKGGKKGLKPWKMDVVNPVDGWAEAMSHHEWGQDVGGFAKILLRFDIEGTVLDPFMGSGTTGIACIRTGRKFVGIERDPKHFETAVQRIRVALEECASELPMGGMVGERQQALELEPSQTDNVRISDDAT